LWGWRKNLGTTIAPEPAALLPRSLRTLTIRLQARNASAQTVAEAMEADPHIKRVLYPGLTWFPVQKLATRQMLGFGGMLTIEVDADAETITRVADRLSLISLAPSLGGAESLATQPVTTTHRGLTPQERERRGTTDSMIRLSVGPEDTVDLIADLTQALDEVVRWPTRMRDAE
jgi:cystathionine gamma-synthase